MPPPFLAEIEWFAADGIQVQTNFYAGKLSDTGAWIAFAAIFAPFFKVSYKYK